MHSLSDASGRTDRCADESGRLTQIFLVNVFLKEWSSVMFRGRRKKESCDRQPEAKTRNGSEVVIVCVCVEGELLGPSVITSISHSQSFQSCSALS